MSTAPASRSSLATVMSLISCADLSETQKRDMLSAVRTVARTLGGAPEAIPADVAGLRRRLDAVSPEAIGMARARWANIRSLLNKGLALAGPTMPGRAVAPLRPDWEALAAGLAQNRRIRILPLLRHLGGKGVGPADVGVGDLEDYRRALFEDRLRAGPEKSWDGLVFAWNACRREVTGWPDVVIERESRRETYILPWSSFPASLKADVDAFLDRLSGRDLSEDGPPRPARPSTLQTRERQLRVAASVLTRSGVAVDRICTIADLVTRDHFQKILRFFLDRKDGKPSPMVAQLGAFLKDVARHWVKADEATVEGMKKVVSRLTERRGGMTAKNRERLRPFDDPENVARFLAVPGRIREELERSKTKSPRIRAVRAQTAAAIAILQAAPIRLRNLVELDLNRNMISRGKRLFLVIAEQDVKNGEFIDFELPAETVEILAWYVREHRPHLVEAQSDALFPGGSDGHKSSGLLGSQISKAVKRHTGMDFNPHLFRHAAGKIFLDARPGQYEVVRRVLGHRSIETTTRIYAGAETRSAGSHFAAVIADRRREIESAAKAKRPRRAKASS